MTEVVKAWKVGTDYYLDENEARTEAKEYLPPTRPSASFLLRAMVDGVETYFPLDISLHPAKVKGLGQ